MKRTLTALTVAATMFASSASAFDPADLQKLKDTNKCVKCDLSRANLSDTILSGANLKYADLSRANLSGARLWRANLKNADLSRANLSGASLWEADLIRANLKNADLTNAELFEADLMDANLTDTDLSGASLTDASLNRTVMKGAIFCNTTAPDRSLIYSGC